MSELSLLIDKERDNIIRAMMHKKSKIVGNNFLEIAKRVNENNKNEFFDFLVELLKYNCEYFMAGCYSPLKSKIGKVFSEEQIQEMDSYIIKKVGLAPNNEILLSSKGSVFIKDDEMFGRFYLTNSRIIVLGGLIEATSTPPATPSLIRMVAGSVKDSRRKTIRQAFWDEMDYEIKSCLYFGFRVPMDRPYDIKRTGGAVYYTIDIGENRYYKLRVKIVPAKVKVKKGQAYQEGRFVILNKIETTLHNMEIGLSQHPVEEVSRPSTSIPIEEDLVPCQFCGKEVKKNSNFCLYCGSKLTQDN